jgi:exoribonuclease R
LAEKKKKRKPRYGLLAIRTMAKAIYTTNYIGHYGLAFDYCHFPSIRRYADVLVHRILDANLKAIYREDRITSKPNANTSLTWSVLQRMQNANQ